MIRRSDAPVAIALALLVAACGSQDEGAPAPGPSAPDTSAGTASAQTGVAAAPADAVAEAGLVPDTGEARPIAADLVRQEWARADNRARCAPMAFIDDGGAQGRPRRATFSGGWAVAFDQPGLRSAYGIAGPGLAAGDAQESSIDALERLRDQWPYFMRLSELPAPAFAGYGLEGAQPYPDDADQQTGLEGAQSLAYVHVEGQGCTYNVWSRLGRAHLETLLHSLRMLPKA